MNYNGWQGNFLPGIQAVIAQGATESSPVATGGMSLVGLILPSIFTGTSVSFEVGDSISGFQANGEVLFGSNPANLDTLTINGTTITFVTGTPTGNQVQIAGSALLTMAALYAFLIASTDTGLVGCTYSLIAGDTLLTVTAVAHGVAGNAYTFAKSSSHITLTPSGGFLSGGGFRPLYDDTNTLLSYTVAAGRAYGFPASLTESAEFLVVKSGSAELNARTLLLSLKGI